MKSKLCLITDTGWWDTDVTVLPRIKQYFDIEVHLIAAKDNNKFTDQEIADFTEKEQIKVKVWKRTGRIRNIRNFLMYLKMFALIKKTNKPGTILHYSYIYDPYINLLMLIVNKFKLLITIHDYQEHIGLVNTARNRLKKLIIAKGNIFHFYSNEEMLKFKEDYPSKQAFYTPMPLKNFDENTLTAVNINRGNAPRVLLFFGFIEYYKGLDRLIKAVNALKRDDFILVVAGACTNWEDYNKLIAGNDKVHTFIRFIENNEISSFFNQADYLVVPYRSATQSGPVMIALNYNLPVIASNLPCFEALIDDRKDGYLFNQQDDKSLEEVLNNALNASGDEYAAIKAAQKMRVEKYNNLVKSSGAVFLQNIKPLLNHNA